MNTIDILQKKDKFLSKLLSIHYPFTAAQIDKYWNVLVLGSAHYSVFLRDTDQTFSPELGLCFNNNIRWTDELRSRWVIGFDIPFFGVEGAGIPCEYDEMESRSHIIPLSLIRELDARNAIELSEWRSLGGPDYDEDGPNLIDISLFTKHYARLDDQELEDLLIENSGIVLLNPTIWANTIMPELSTEIVNALLDKQLSNYESKQEDNSGSLEADNSRRAMQG